jgi:hypothetical protein
MKTNTFLTDHAISVLREAAQAILAEPKLYDQTQDCVPKATCGTTGCIFGFVASIMDLKPKPSLYSEVAIVLGIPYLDKDGRDWVTQDHTELTPAAKLFYYWPEEWQIKYQRANTPYQKAKVAADRIEYFIETGE